MRDERALRLRRAHRDVELFRADSHSMRDGQRAAYRVQAVQYLDVYSLVISLCLAHGPRDKTIIAPGCLFAGTQKMTAGWILPQSMPNVNFSPINHISIILLNG